MKKFLKKAGVMALSVSAILAMVTGALADPSSPSDSVYTPVFGPGLNDSGGHSILFNKYLVLDKSDSVPNVGFAFDIEPGEGLVFDDFDGDGEPDESCVYYLVGGERFLRLADAEDYADAHSINHDDIIESSVHALQIFAGPVVRDAGSNIIAPSISKGSVHMGGESVNYNEWNISSDYVNSGIATFDALSEVYTGDASGDLTRSKNNRNDVTDSGDSDDDLVQYDPVTEKYAVSRLYVDFSGVAFDQPGVYRYVITEKPETLWFAPEDRDGNGVCAFVNPNDVSNGGAWDDGVYHDIDISRILDVYVVDNNGSLQVSNYVLHTVGQDGYDDDYSPVVFTTVDYGSGSVVEQSDLFGIANEFYNGSINIRADIKSDGFTNECDFKDLKITKDVSGNQASRDKYFKIQLVVGGLLGNELYDEHNYMTYTVSIDDDSDPGTNDGNADSVVGRNSVTRDSYIGLHNPTSVTAEELANGVYFYLKHGQKVVIRGLPPFVTYRVMEFAEDYLSSVPSGVINVVDGTVGFDFDRNGRVENSDDWRGDESWKNVENDSSNDYTSIGNASGGSKLVSAGFVNTRAGFVPTGIVMSIAPYAGTGLLGLAGVGTYLALKKRKYSDD